MLTFGWILVIILAFCLNKMQSEKDWLQERIQELENQIEELEDHIKTLRTKI